MTRLDRAFFREDTRHVARELLGKKLVFGIFEGLITETEAYRGEGDPACHAARGRTPRTDVMFGPPGVSYVYLIYGLYCCFNIVTEAEGFAAAVLIRGLRLQKPATLNLDGPGKLSKHLNMTRHHSGVDLVTSPTFYVEETALKPAFTTTPRIGLTKGEDLLWRFVVEEGMP